MQKSEWRVLFFNPAAHPYPVSRILTLLILALTVLAPILAVCGCHDVKGAANGTAGQLSEREKRDKEAMEILDSGTKR
jgi:hypothetical protein